MTATSNPDPGMAGTHANKIIAIQALVARMFGLQTGELDMTSLKRSAAIPRQIAIYLAKQETNASLMEIGNLFGGKHHTTVLNAIEHVEALRHTDSAINIAITMVLRDLKSGLASKS